MPDNKFSCNIKYSNDLKLPIDDGMLPCKSVLNNDNNRRLVSPPIDGGISAFHIAVGVDNDLEFTRLFLNYNV